MRRIILILVLLFLVITSLFQQNIVVGKDLNGPSDQIIIRWRPFVHNVLKDRVAKSVGVRSLQPTKLANTFVARVAKEDVQKVIGSLNKNLLVEYSELDYIAQAFEVPNDPIYPEQWGLRTIDANGAWERTKGSSQVDIAIIDTGVDYNHPDLKGKLVASVNCTVSSCPVFFGSDPYGHGTHVAGIAAGNTNNGIGIAGVSWEGRIMSVKVLDDSGRGYYSWVANGIIWAADNGAEIINLSLGGSYPSRTLENAIDYAWSRGVLVVAAAGNNNTSAPSYPAYYQNSLAVAATSEADQKAEFSNWGLWVDVAAPGESIVSTYKGDYAYLSGTSMSTPFVSGVAALVLSSNPSFSNKQLRQKIEASSQEIQGTGTYWRFGRINACISVDCNSINITPTLVPSPTPTPTSQPSPFPSATPTSFPSVTPTNTPTLPPSPTPTLNPSPSPTPTPTPTPNLPWWCRYVPRHYTCRR